jgi:hypothetical protein
MGGLAEAVTSTLFDATVGIIAGAVVLGKVIFAARGITAVQALR